MHRARLTELVMNTPLMIEAGKLNVILSVLADHVGPLDLSALPAPAAAAKQAVATPEGARIVNGVGILSVAGSLVHRGSWMDAASGLQNYQALSNQFQELVQDGSVQHIILDMNSHGGSVNGVFDFTDEIFAARAVKPVTAIVDENAYSAAYMLASAATEVIVTRTAGVGSIGVIAAHADRSEMNAKDGIKVTPVFAGARKNDFSPNEPLSKEAHEILQAEVNRNYDLFVATVARNRAMTEAAVRGTEAGLFTGAAAIDAGLADRLQPVREAYREILNRYTKATPVARSGRVSRAAEAMRIVSS